MVRKGEREKKKKEAEEREDRKGEREREKMRKKRAYAVCLLKGRIVPLTTFSTLTLPFRT